MNGQSFAAWLVLSSAAFSDGSQARKTPGPSAYLGCYRVTLSAWSGSAGLDPRATTPPAAIELTSDRVEQFKKTEMYWVKLGPTAKAGAFPLSFWHITPQGHVEITFSMGFQGMTLKLAPKGSALVGTARASGDVNSDELFQVAAARADKMDCGVRK